MPHIHPTAVVDPRAELAKDVQIGPLCVIEQDVILGPGCRMEARASIKRGTTLGANNTVCEGAILGGRPQHKLAGEDVGRLVIGDGNHLRENVTVHRGLKAGGDTIIGDSNYIMVNSHVGHDCHIGNDTLIANNAMLAGHVTLADRAYVSGAVGVHQFCRIGMLAMLSGHARITRDVPPFVNVDGFSSLVVGLNTVGLRRAGFTSDDIVQLKAAYRHIYRSGLPFDEMVAQLAESFADGPAAAYHEFFSGGQRGFVPERRSPRKATLKLPSGEAVVAAPGKIRKAG